MLQALVEYASYMPHGYCLFWQPWLVVLYAGSDLLIFASYAAIPVALMSFLRQRPDLKYRQLVALFAAFILLCGITHLISVVTLWVPVYPLHGMMKLLTGIVSAATAVVLFRLIPVLVRIPRPAQLEAANAELRAEIASHETTLAALEATQRDLEDRVARRTADLSEANRRLSIASHEAVHRGRNLLTMVDAIARQTGRGAADLPEFLERFSGRVGALSTATAAVIDSADTGAARVEAVVRRQLDPVLQTFGGRVRVEGPEVEVGAEAAQQIALALHELATNALKHGALAGPCGAIDVGWQITGAGKERRFVLEWRETGGATEAAAEAAADGTADAPATGGGFGTRLLTWAVPAMLRGSAERVVAPDGLRYRLDVPLAVLVPRTVEAPEAPGTTAGPDGARWVAGREGLAGA